jgi:hypothetical protein
MDINKLRTPQGLNQYLNQEIRTLAVKVPDYLMQIFLWQKVKFDFLANDEIAKKLFEDNDKHLLAIETNEVTTKLMIGYLHISDDIHINSTNDSKVISDKAIEHVKGLTKISIDNKWDDSQIFIISTFRLSSYNKIDLSQFPNNAKYFYLTDSPDQKDKFYELKIDKDTNDFMEGDILLKNLLKIGKTKNSRAEYWSCDICGGTNETGCLYFDPTECPKFT